MTDSFSFKEIEIIRRDLGDRRLDDPSLHPYVAIRAAGIGRVVTLRYVAAADIDLSRGCGVRAELGYHKYAQTEQGPIIIATALGHSDAVEFLKDQPKVDINAKFEGKTLAELAKDNGHPELAAKIEQWTAEKNAAAPTRNDDTRDVPPTAPWPR